MTTMKIKYTLAGLELIAAMMSAQSRPRVEIVELAPPRGPKGKRARRSAKRKHVTAPKAKQVKA